MPEKLYKYIDENGSAWWGKTIEDMLASFGCKERDLIPGIFTPDDMDDLVFQALLGTEDTNSE